jgi:uncharacterized membrane protein YbhN (UPF0104 family)
MHPATVVSGREQLHDAVVGRPDPACRPASRPGAGGAGGARQAGVIIIVAVAGLGLTVGVLAGSRDELLAAVAALVAVCPGWVTVAVLAEAVSYLTRGSAVRAVLHSADGGKPRMSVLELGATTLAGDAVAYCLPFGFAAGGAVAVEQLRRRRVPPVVAGWTLTVATLLYVAVLAVLALVAVALAGATGTANPVPGLQQTALILILVVALLAIPALALGMGHAAAARLGRQPTPRRRCRGTWAPTGPGAALVLARARNRWAQLRLLRLSSRSTAAAATRMLVSWLADISVLAVAFLALGAQPPWLGLLLAYCAGQIASSLPITPGGLGVVEASLTVALVAFGGCTAATLAAVLLYRLISHWLIIPTGGVAWLLLRTTSPSGHGDHLAVAARTDR